jgi:hypothetical protein
MHGWLTCTRYGVPVRVPCQVKNLQWELGRSDKDKREWLVEMEAMKAEEKLIGQELLRVSAERDEALEHVARLQSDLAAHVSAREGLGFEV